MPSDFNQSFSNDDSSSSITIALTVILLVFLFLGFFSIYVCKCLMESFLHSRNLRRTPSGNIAGNSSSPTKTGLDPLLINSFPTFPYSSIKDFRKDKYGLECAICLVEFEDDSFLRLLTLCCHVFHQECIDLWLESHKTCPVCRCNLDSSHNSPEKSQESEHDHRSLEEAISIEIRDDVGDDNDETREINIAGNSDDDDDDKNESKKVEIGVNKFTRSHSTGHSMIKSKKEEEEEEEIEIEDRYRLRLPEDIKIKIIRGHNWTGSCVSFEELSRHQPGNGGPFVEVSGSDFQTKD